MEDLLYYLPFRYEDRLNPRSIGELRAGEMATVIAEVRNTGLFRTKRFPIFELIAGQGPSTLKCIWFRGDYLRDRFKPGTTGGSLRQGGIGVEGAAAFRSISHNLKFCRAGRTCRGKRRRVSLELDEDRVEREVEKSRESLEIGRIVPIYESAAGSQKLTSRWFRGTILRRAAKTCEETLPDGVPASQYSAAGCS